MKEGTLQYSNSNNKKVSQCGNSVSRTQLSGSGQRQEGSVHGYQRQTASSQLLQMQLTSTQSKLMQAGSQNLIENLHMWPSGPGSQFSSYPELFQEKSMFPEGTLLNGINTVDRKQETINQNFEKKIFKFNVEVVNRQQSELMNKLVQVQYKKYGINEINEPKKVEWSQDMNIGKVYQQIEIIVAQFLEIELQVLDMLSLRIVRVDQNEKMMYNQQNQMVEYLQAHNGVYNMTDREPNTRSNNAGQQQYRIGINNQQYPNNQNVQISNHSNILIPLSQANIYQNQNYQYHQQSNNFLHDNIPQQTGNRQMEYQNSQEEQKQNFNIANGQVNRNLQNTMNQIQTHQNLPVQQNQIIVMPSFGTQVGIQGAMSQQAQNFGSIQQPASIGQNKSSSGNNNTMTQKSLPLSPALSQSYHDQINQLSYLNPIINNQIQNYPVQQQQYMFFNNINMNNEQFKHQQQNQQIIQPGQNIFQPLFMDQNLINKDQNNQITGMNYSERDRMRIEDIQKQDEVNMDCDISQSFHQNRRGNESITSIISDTLSQQILRPFQFKQQSKLFDSQHATQNRNEFINNQMYSSGNYKQITEPSSFYTQRNIEYQNVKRNEMIPTIDLQNIGQMNSQSHRQFPNQQNMYPINSARNYQSNQYQTEPENIFQNLYNKIDQKNQQLTQQLDNVHHLVNGQNAYDQNDIKVNQIMEELKENFQNFAGLNEINKDQLVIQQQPESPQISIGQNDLKNKQVSTPNQNNKNRRFSQYKIQNAQKIQSPLPLYNKAHSYIQKQKNQEMNQISEKQDQLAHKNQLSKVEEEQVLYQSKDSNLSKRSSHQVQESLIELVKQSGFKKGFQDQDAKINQQNVNQTNSIQPTSQKNEINGSSQNSASYQSLQKEKSQIRNMRSQEFIDGNDQQQYRNYKMLVNSKNSASSNLFMYSDTKSVMPLQQSHPLGGSIDQRQLNSNDVVTKGTNDQNSDDKLQQNQQQKLLLNTPIIVNRSRNSSKKRIHVMRSKESDLKQGKKPKNVDNVSSEISQSLSFIDFENKEQQQNIKNTKNQNSENDSKQNINNQSLTRILEKLGLKLGLDTGVILNRLINKSSDVKNSQKYFELKQQKNNDINQQQMLIMINYKMELVKSLKFKLKEQQEDLLCQVGNLQNFKIFNDASFLKNEEFELYPESQNILLQNSNKRQVLSSNKRQISSSNQRLASQSNQRKNQKQKKKKQMKTPKLLIEMNPFEKTEKLERMKTNLIIPQDPLEKNENDAIENSKDESEESSSFSMTMTQDYAMTHNDNHNFSTRQNQIHIVIPNQNINLVAQLSPDQNPHTPIQSKQKRQLQSFETKNTQQPFQNKQNFYFETKSAISESNFKSPLVKSRVNNTRQILNNGKLRAVKKVSQNTISQNVILQNYNEEDFKSVMNQKQEELSEKSKYIANRKQEQTYSDISQLSYIGCHKKQKFDDQKTVLNQSSEELSEKSRYIAEKKQEQTYSDISQISYIGHKKHEKFDDQKTLINRQDDCISTISALIPQAPGREFEKESNYSQISRFGPQKSTFRNYRNDKINDYYEVKTVQGNQQKGNFDNQSQSSIPAPQRMLEKTYSEISYVSRNQPQFKVDKKKDQSNKFELKQKINFQSQAAKDPLFKLKEQIKGVSSGDCDSPYFQLKTQTSQANINSFNIVSQKESNLKNSENCAANQVQNAEKGNQKYINLADFENTVEAEKLLEEINQIQRYSDNENIQLNENQSQFQKYENEQLNSSQKASNDLKSQNQQSEIKDNQQINSLSTEKNNKDYFQLNKNISNTQYKSTSGQENQDKYLRNQWSNKVFNIQGSSFGAAFYLKNPSKELEKLDISEQENEESNSDEQLKEKLRLENLKKQNLIHISDVKPASTSDNLSENQKQENQFNQHNQSQDENSQSNNNEQEIVCANAKLKDFGRNFTIQNLLNLE